MKLTAFFITLPLNLPPRETGLLGFSNSVTSLNTNPRFLFNRMDLYSELKILCKSADTYIGEMICLIILYWI